MPVLYTGSVLFPTEESAFVVRDPPLVLMFQSGVGVNGWFGHCLHKSNAPEAVRDAEFVSSDDVKVGLKGPGITVGCVCEVKQIEDLENNQIKVSYKCIRRIRVLDYCVEKSLFPEVEFEWLDDFESQQDEHVNKTEVLLWECLLEISKLEKKLGKSLSSLPKSLIEVAPSRAQGVPNGTRAEKEKNIWLGRTEAKKPPTVNSKQNDSSSKQMSPYQVIGENSYKYQRQELFSFAAASLVAESVNERLALLTSRNTRAKLEWTLASAEPYLEQLRTEFGIYNALK